MKHILRMVIPVILSFFLLFTASPVSADAADNAVLSRTVVDFDNGSREETTVLQYASDPARGVITGEKIKNHYSQSRELVWRVKLTGSFTYNGTTSSCTEAHTEIYFYKSGWSVVSENTTHSGNTASTSVILGKNVLGVTMPGAYVNLSLSCDKDGNLS